jgi:EamA-like transporter family
LNPWNKANRVTKDEDTGEVKKFNIPKLDRKSNFFIVATGMVLFAGSSLQQAGLKYTTAGNAGFITTLNVIFVPIILVIFMREKIHWIAWVGAGIAISGSLLLSTGGALRFAPGDSWEMAGAVMWAVDVILVSQAVKHMEVLTFLSRPLFRSSCLEPPGELVFASTPGRSGWGMVDDSLHRNIIDGNRLYPTSPGTEICPAYRCDDFTQHGGSVCCISRVYFSGRDDDSGAAGWVRDDPDGSDHYPIERGQIEDTCSPNGWMKNMVISRYVHD